MSRGGGSMSERGEGAEGPEYKKAPCMRCGRGQRGRVPETGPRARAAQGDLFAIVADPEVPEAPPAYICPSCEAKQVFSAGVGDMVSLRLRFGGIETRRKGDRVVVHGRPARRVRPIGRLVCLGLDREWTGLNGRALRASGGQVIRVEHVSAIPRGALAGWHSSAGVAVVCVRRMVGDRALVEVVRTVDGEYIPGKGRSAVHVRLIDLRPLRRWVLQTPAGDEIKLRPRRPVRVWRHPEGVDLGVEPPPEPEARGAREMLERAVDVLDEHRAIVRELADCGDHECAGVDGCPVCCAWLDRERQHRAPAVAI